MSEWLGNEVKSAVSTDEATPIDFPAPLSRKSIGRPMRVKLKSTRLSGSSWHNLAYGCS